MNGDTTRKKRQMLITKYGEFCTCCGKLPKEGTLVLNRIDNNNKNTRLENLQLLCRSCVNLKRKTRSDDDLCVNTQTKEETCLSINKEKESKFYNFVYDLLDEQGKLPYKDVIYSGAEYLELSPVTTERYLKKMISGYGNLDKERQWGDRKIIKYKENYTRNGYQSILEKNYN